MLRIAMNGTALLSPLTGIGQYTYHLAKGLQASKEVELDLFYGKSWSKTLQDKPSSSIATIKYLIKRFVPDPYAFSRFVQQHRFDSGIKTNRSDIYHEPNFLAFKCKQPTIITVHDLSWIRFPHTHPVERVRAMEKYFEPGLQRASLVLTDSDFIKKELIQVFGVKPERILPIALGVEPLFRPRNALETQAVLHEHSLQHGQYLLAVGTLEPRKNLQVALHAFLQLPAAIRKHYPLVLVGMKGWHTSALEAQMAPLIRSGEVRQLGYLSREDLATIIAGALSLVYPSIYEGFGLPPLEAMACAVPVIASNVSSLPEVVGDTGLLINDPNDASALTEAMQKMLTDPMLRNTLSASALARSKEFTWGKCVSQTLDAYRQALQITQ
jgi:glycosyltransferase involved in cell wall biosynthesis